MSHQQQSFWRLPSPGQSRQTINRKISLTNNVHTFSPYGCTEHVSYFLQEVTQLAPSLWSNYYARSHGLISSRTLCRPLLLARQVRCVLLSVVVFVVVVVVFLNFFFSSGLLLKPWRTRKSTLVLNLRPTCVSFDYLLSWTYSRLVTPCVDFGRAQIRTQVDASFSPFGHPTHVDTSWSQANCNYGFLRLANPLVHPDLKYVRKFWYWKLASTLVELRFVRKST